MAGPSQSDATFTAPVIGSALFEGFCKLFFACYSTLTVEGSHHLPDPPFLLCSNHSSHADSAALMTASGRSFRHFALLGASDYFFDSRRVRWLVSPWMNVIPIERRPGPKALAACLANCRRFLEETQGILILYPEGTRSVDGEMRPFKAGAGVFAIELGVPVVPAYVEGAHRVLPKGRSIPRPAPVTVRFGEPLPVPICNIGGKLTREWRRYVVEKLATSIRTLGAGYEEHAWAAGVSQRG
jgi:1-acyl-sn-glycerol-3-phosphate acyltransferase